MTVPNNFVCSRTNQQVCCICCSAVFTATRAHKTTRPIFGSNNSVLEFEFLLLLRTVFA